MRFLSNKEINLFLSIKNVYSVFFCPLMGYLGKGLPELRSFRYKSFRCNVVSLLVASLHHKLDSLQPTFCIKRFRTVENELQSNNELSQRSYLTTLQRIDFIMQRNDFVTKRPYSVSPRPSDPRLCLRQNSPLCYKL